MVTERRLGTEENPDIVDQGKQIEIPPEEQTFDEQLAEALEVTLADDEIIIAEPEEETMEIPFDANIAEYLDESELNIIANKLISSINGDKESRKEWEKTYTDGLKYLGMRFDEQRSNRLKDQVALSTQYLLSL